MNTNLRHNKTGQTVDQAVMGTFPSPVLNKVVFNEDVADQFLSPRFRKEIVHPPTIVPTPTALVSLIPPVVSLIPPVVSLIPPVVSLIPPVVSTPTSPVSVALTSPVISINTDDHKHSIYGRPFNLSRLRLPVGVRVIKTVVLKGDTGFYRRASHLKSEFVNILIDPFEEVIEELLPEQEKEELLEEIEKLYKQNKGLWEDGIINKKKTKELITKARDGNTVLDIGKLRNFKTYVVNMIKYNEQKKLLVVGIEFGYLMVSMGIEYTFNLKMKSYFEQLNASAGFYADSFLTRPQIQKVMRTITRGSNRSIDPPSMWRLGFSFSGQIICIIVVAIAMKKSETAAAVIAPFLNVVQSTTDEYLFKNKPPWDQFMTLYEKIGALIALKKQKSNDEPIVGDGVDVDIEDPDKM